MIDFEMERQKGLLHSQMPEHKFLIKKTEGFIKWALNQVSNPYLSCSFGKDSSVLLHLVLKLKKDIPVYCFMCEQSKLLDNYDDLVDFWITKCNLNIIEFDQSDPLKINRMSALSKKIESDSFFNGIRAEESKYRRISLKKYGKFHKTKSNGKFRIAPLAWWKEKDIMSYMFSNDLPFLDTYIKMGGKGRTGTFLPNANSDNLRNALKSLKLKSVSDYNNLLIKYPTLTEIANV